MYFKMITGRDYFKDYLPQKLWKTIQEYFNGERVSNLKIIKIRVAVPQNPLYHEFVKENISLDSSNFLSILPMREIKNYIIGLYKKDN